MFVADGISEPRAISSMPGVFQHTLDSLSRAAEEAVAAGVGGVMLFGVPKVEDKDENGSGATDPDGILNRGLARLKADLGDSTVIMADNMPTYMVRDDVLTGWAWSVGVQVLMVEPAALLLLAGAACVS